MTGQSFDETVSARHNRRDGVVIQLGLTFRQLFLRIRPTAVSGAVLVP
jgi:hypothetical protein